MSQSRKHVDYYEVLEVSRNATDEEIKKGYRKQALRWHPDKNHGNVENAAEKFKIVSEAYQVLSNPRRRQIYDVKGCNVGEAGYFTDEDVAAAAASFDLSSFSSPADIYRQFFPEDKVFADLLDSLDYGKNRGRSAYGGTTVDTFDANAFLSPADLYKQFFPEDKEFGDFLASFDPSQQPPAGNNMPQNSKSTETDRQPAAGYYMPQNSKSTETDRQKSAKNDLPQSSKSSETDRPPSAENGLRRSSRSNETTLQKPTSNKKVPETNDRAQHTEQTTWSDRIRNATAPVLNFFRGSSKDSLQNSTDAAPPKK